MNVLPNVFISSAGQAVAETTAELTINLHNYCHAHGWPVSVVMNLKVELDGGKYHIFVPKFVENEVYALEYGDGTKKRGTHALFSFLNNLSETTLDEAMAKQLITIGLA